MQRQGKTETGDGFARREGCRAGVCVGDGCAKRGARRGAWLRGGVGVGFGTAREVGLDVARGTSWRVVARWCGDWFWHCAGGWFRTVIVARGAVPAFAWATDLHGGRGAVPRFAWAMDVQSEEHVWRVVARWFGGWFRGSVSTIERCVGDWCVDVGAWLRGGVGVGFGTARAVALRQCSWRGARRGAWLRGAREVDLGVGFGAARAVGVGQCSIVRRVRIVVEGCFGVWFSE